MSSFDIQDTEMSILTTFYATVGVKLGLWDRKTRSLRADAEEHPTFRANLEAVRALLRRGWTVTELQHRIQSLSRSGVKAPLISTVIHGDPVAAEQTYNPDYELLEDGKAYYHRTLKRMQPPRYRMNEDGSLECTQDPSISLKESFTLGDLTSYYIQHLGQWEGISPRRVGPALMWMLKQGLTPDEILFAVDAAARDGSDRMLIAPFDLMKYGYIAQARETLKELKHNDPNARTHR